MVCLLWMNHHSIKEMPQGERPYEKAIEKGAESLSDAELLAVILRSGSKNKNSVEMAREIIGLCKDGNLSDLSDLTFMDFMKVAGVGRIKALQIECVCELFRRMARPAFKEKIAFSDPQTIAYYYMEQMGKLTQEEMRLIFLDTKNIRIKDVILNRGTVNYSLVSTRELFLEALRYHAVRVIMLHNHPSGDPKPSMEDIRLTKKVKEAGELLDIRLLDHLVIGNGCYVSMKAQGILDSLDTIIEET